MQESVFEAFARGVSSKRQPEEIAEALHLDSGTTWDEHLQAGLLGELAAFEPVYYLVAKAAVAHTYGAANDALERLEGATASITNNRSRVSSLIALTQVFKAALHSDHDGRRFSSDLFGTDEAYRAAIAATSARLNAVLARFSHNEQIFSAGMDLLKALQMAPGAFAEAVIRGIQTQLVRDVPFRETLAGAEALPAQFGLLARLVAVGRLPERSLEHLRFTLSCAHCARLSDGVRADLFKLRADLGMGAIDVTSAADEQFVGEVLAECVVVSACGNLRADDNLLIAGFDDGEQLAELYMRLEPFLPAGKSAGETQVPLAGSPRELAQVLWNLGLRSLKPEQAT